MNVTVDAFYTVVETICNTTYAVLFTDWFQDYIDLYVFIWLLWLFTPIIISFLLPAVIFIFLYLSALFLLLYRHRHYIRDAYARDLWDGARYTLATCWDVYAWLWHGYEVEGLENIPDSGPALLVYYHGALPVDIYYLLAKCILYKHRVVRAVGDRFLFRIPGFSLLMEVFKVFPGTVQSCAQILQDGELLTISPGGVLEAQFGDEYYNLIWGNRVGFAKVALEGKAPIVPVFTQNIREAFRSVNIGKGWFRQIYNKTRLPLVPIYGGFPVKLKTYVGKPIPHDPSLTPEELVQKTAVAIEELIKEHQRIPGSICFALLERVYNPSKKKKEA